MTPAHNLLILYTGGTIGMQMTAAGLAPASGFAERLRAAQAAEPERPVPPWQLVELSPPIDSANIGQQHWLDMQQVISTAVDKQGFDAVLVLHGTDTLAYSAAALSFLLLGINVPVLLTGSMLPAGAEGSDAWDNLFGALALLKQGLKPGVQLYFNGQLIAGTRASKVRSEAFDAFVDHQRPRLALRANSLPPALYYHQPRRLVPIAVQPLYPGLSIAQLNAVLNGGAEAVLLECYGSGTAPSDDAAFIQALTQAHKRGVLLAAISQCGQGHVEFGVYAAGSALAEIGVLSGGAMSREAALGKLLALLGSSLERAEVERLFTLDLAAEMAAYPSSNEQIS